jgi:cobalt-zinc-cadmium efflux system membrane fusion protein
VYEQDISRIATGDRATFTVRSYPGRTFAGQVSWIADTIDEATRTLPIRLEVDNEDRVLKPGMFARITIALEKRSARVLLPGDAVLQSGGRTIVFVPEGPGRFEIREVERGLASRTHVEILHGLEVGELVVIRGAFQLKATLVTSSLGGHAGHGH